jgi:hypothetical protein
VAADRVKLAELDPMWISLGGHSRKSGFVFKCPHCQQASIMRGLDLRGLKWVPAGVDVIWQWFGDFPDLTVSPSIDASKSGHWHGHITKGEIVL